MPTDEELMTAAGRGDMDAFEELIRRHQQLAINVAYRFLGNREEAEDLAQQAFLNILERAESYRPTAQFKTFLYRVVANACMDYRRKKRPQPRAFLPERESVSSDPGSRMAREERVEMVREAIDGLPERQRMALVLQQYEDLSYLEIADVMDCSRSAVESLLVRARRNLRDALEDFF